jgi:hypothetical protein
MAVERTLILIKPDATERALSGELLARIERRGFTVVGGKLLRVSAELGKEHYAEHSEKPFFGELVDVHHLRADVGARRRGRGRDRDDAEDDRRDESRRRRARHDPRRLRDVDAEQPHPRLRLARVGTARDLAVVRRR